MFDAVKRMLFSPPPETLHAPEGAWIPPAIPVDKFAGLSSDGGRPVMDAAMAHAHNESLFTALLHWGPLMALVMLAFAWIWTRVR